MACNRRNFIRNLCYLPWLTMPLTHSLAHSLAHSAEPIDEKPKNKIQLPDNLIIGAGKYRHSQNSNIQYVLSLINYSARTRRLIDLDFFAHGLALNPSLPGHIALFEKKGRGACEIDLISRRVVRTINTVKERLFYGHGTYSTDGSLLYCTESYKSGLDGVIAVRDAKNLQLLGTFPSYGKEPHECRLTHNGKTLVVTNGGGEKHSEPPNIAYIDIASEQLLNRLMLSNSKINTGHMALGAEEQLVVVSAPRPGLAVDDLGGVSMGKIDPSRHAAGQANREPFVNKGRDGQLKSMQSPFQIIQKMKGEALSVAIQNKLQIAAVTHPDGNMVTFWSIPKQQLLKVIELTRPLGITLNREQSVFLITHGRTNLLEVDSDTLQPRYEQQLPMTYMSGSHIYNWSLEKGYMQALI